VLCFQATWLGKHASAQLGQRWGEPWRPGRDRGGARVEELTVTKFEFLHPHDAALGWRHGVMASLSKELLGRG